MTGHGNGLNVLVVSLCFIHAIVIVVTLVWTTFTTAMNLLAIFLLVCVWWTGGCVTTMNNVDRLPRQFRIIQELIPPTSTCFLAILLFYCGPWFFRMKGNGLVDQQEVSVFDGTQWFVALFGFVLHDWFDRSRTITNTFPLPCQ